jgi:hypothetical protein
MIRRNPQGAPAGRREEIRMSDVRRLVLGGIGLAALAALCAGCTEETVVPEEICGNGIDDDGDGRADCLDSDCAQAPSCVDVPAEVDCDDLRDDDGDGRTDCEDPDCAAASECTFETHCGDGVDNDLDGATDCDDSDCAARSPCVETWCTDGIDDDGDGATDCDDSDCAADPACVGATETNCTDGVDDDGDGSTDCADSDCAADPACAPESNCTDGVDNDGDGSTDCDDSDCAADPACPPACAEDTYEENDDIATATDAGTIAPTEWLAVVDPDEDFFAVDVCAGGALTVDVLFTGADGNIDAVLQDSTGAPLDSSTGSTDNEQLTWTATTAATVYVRVFLQSGSCNVYRLVVALTGC